ncbi:aminotransferase class V-fold PLP-dependent enzyme [Phycicoccus sp.]|uniref:aminotransferase class V-fold PLP-dependent enzyme n=1 Tax=Phycicoccus sp. TaxID=1902410 RepID=UPI002C4C1A03|nr:aminotransferase class V-fold PLP-dependent enzyme [Phycicoccus sp.]HMM95862.1 aminotransferase class V-fold PLP-dependent enzyme [Phycicoccus sp.]
MPHSPVEPSPEGVRAGPADAPAEGVLDASRGPLHPLAARTLEAAVGVAWADPTRVHGPGRAARAHLDTARAVLAGALGVRPGELSVHPSAEDALAVGLEGLRHARRRTGDVVVAGAAERSVLLLRAGDAAPVPVDGLGRVDAAAWVAAVAAPGVAAAVLQTANGEVGTRQPVATLDAAARAAGVPLLLDATASLGRDPLGPEGSVVVADAASFGGPPLGLLGVRTGTRWSLPGPRAEAEQGRVLAAPWVPLVLAAAEAWRQTEAAAAEDATQARALVARVRAAAAGIRDVEVLGDPDDRLPHVVTFSVLLADGEALVDELARRGLAVASGSACTSSVLRPSHVLAAMGVLTHGNVRVVLPLASVSPGREADVERLRAELTDAVRTVRRRMGTEDL